MNIEIIQKQDKDLLDEHARSSYNFTWISKNEWLMALIFLCLGIGIILFYEPLKIMGYILSGIGILELIKYPNRTNKWVNKKMNENIFNKEIKYLFHDDSLTISYDEINKKIPYNEMRQCLISDTGVLFKITFTEYYYISFKSLIDISTKREIVNFLKSRFKKENIFTKEK